MLKKLSVKWKLYFAIFWPLLCLLFLLIDQNDMIHLLIVSLIVHGYILTQIIPTGASALFLLFLLPLLHVESSSFVARAYFSTTSLTIATIFNAIALQYSGLHERITLWLILKLGCTLKRITWALMLVSHFLSMWLSNVFAANIMIPVAIKIYSCINQRYDEPENEAPAIIGDWMILGIDVVRCGKASDVEIAFIFAILFGAIAGGITFMKGSPTNIAFLLMYSNRLNCYFNQDNWFLFTVPVTFVMSVLNCLWLQIAFLGLFKMKWFHLDDMVRYEEVIKNERSIERLYRDKGAIRWHEVWVGFVFLYCLVLWTFRKPFDQNGWEYFLTDFHIQNSTISIFITFIMVVIPSESKFIYSFSQNPDKYPKTVTHGLITWRILQNRVNWGDILTFGALNTIGVLHSNSGLSKLLAGKLIFMKNWPITLIIISATLFVVCITEFCTNPFASSAISSTLIELAITLDLHPMSISFIGCLCCSLAFVSPFGSRMLSLVTQLKQLKRKQFIKIGLLPKIMSYTIIISSYFTYGRIFYAQELQKGWVYSDNVCYCSPCETDVKINHTDIHAHYNMLFTFTTGLLLFFRVDSICVRYRMSM